MKNVVKIGGEVSETAILYNQAMEHVRIVLVRPRNPENIGASARAMANFGFSDLVVVAPYEPVWRESCAAVGAEKIMTQARTAPGVAQAVSDCHIALATTCVRRRSPDREVVGLPDIRSWLAQRAGEEGVLKVALLFGSEKTGLSNLNISHCHALLNIPTTDETPSINLGQAVALCCYELSRQTGPASPAGGRTRSPEGSSETKLPTLEEVESTAALLRKSLEKTEYFPSQHPESNEALLRNTLLRLKLSKADLYILRRIILRLGKG